MIALSWKKLFLVVAILAIFFSVFNSAQALTVITTCQQLQDMNLNLAEDYELGNDIDCSMTNPSDPDFDAGGTWSDSKGFEPIGDNVATFTGTLDGNEYIISGLFINRPLESYVGLFSASTNATISNAGLVDGTITGSSITGSFVGSVRGGSTLDNVYAQIDVTGGSSTGGLVGSFSGSGNTLEDSYFIGSVTGGSVTGGIVGNIGGTSGVISRAYSTGVVIASAFRVGGFSGTCSGASITDAYATGAVTGTEQVGGFIGLRVPTCTITNVYSAGFVSGISTLGGLVGTSTGGTTTSSYWDTQTSGQATSAVGTGKLTAEMKQQLTFSGWDFSVTPVWDIVEDATYPFFSFSPGITVTESSGATSVTEDETTDTFTVVLNSAISTDVVMTVASGNTAEAIVSPSTLTFTAANWDDAQTVTVTGVDDAIIDGDQISTITISITDGSSDDTYDSVADETVSVTTVDDGEPVLSVDNGPSGTHFGCKDPNATNYKPRFVKHKQELCRYNTPEKIKESIEATIPNSQCPFFSQYYRFGDKGDGIKRVQTFLSGQNFATGTIDGIYGPQTNEAVKQFQLKYSAEVLQPWNISTPTGRLYQSTRHKMNELAGCDEGEVKLDNGVVIK